MRLLLLLSLVRQVHGWLDLAKISFDRDYTWWRKRSESYISAWMRFVCINAGLETCQWLHTYEHVRKKKSTRFVVDNFATTRHRSLQSIIFQICSNPLIPLIDINFFGSTQKWFKATKFARESDLTKARSIARWYLVCTYIQIRKDTRRWWSIFDDVLCFASVFCLVLRQVR